VRRALLDTSFVIAPARGEDFTLGEPPEEAAICAVTSAACTTASSSPATSSAPAASPRSSSPSDASRPYPSTRTSPRITGACSPHTRRHRRKKLATADALIAATAAAHGLPLITRDRDFANLDGVDAIIV